MPFSPDDQKLYYSIGEAAEHLGVPTTKIRYWDGEFPSLKPMKNNRGERRFTKKHLELLARIKYLLLERGFTIEGARRELAALKKTPAGKLEAIERLRSVRDRLKMLL